MAKLAIREALNQALAEEMERDPSVFLMGEEVAEYDGAYKVSKGLLQQFGAKRVIDSPISEAGFAGLGVGAAMLGLRPVIEMMTWNFGIQGFDQIINHAAKLHYMSGGQFKIPIVYRGPNGAAHMLSSQHSQNVDPMLSNVPGLKVVSISTPADAKGLLKASIRDDNPVIFLESEMMYGFQGEVPDGEHIIPLGLGDIKRPGDDITLITWGKVTHKALEAASALEQMGIRAEVIDLRSLVPLDETLIFHSIRKTNRCVIVEENWPVSSFGSYVAERIQYECFDHLDAPIGKVCQTATPVPYAENLEELALPRVDAIIAAAKKATYKK
ncbi:MAG: pyruvate dehydrogenase complex E1 component subunit beta [Zetaproteobacteria bacterium]|nr:pyruvate dehydrogenase complex E1 component subunit beta [Zetaproteobacteria bacterium]